MYNFNVRVYGLLLDDDNQILISDELAYGVSFSKFPGGGLEYGEGTIDALKREFVEECETQIEIIDHLYTVDFFEQSSFNNSQIISIYYLVKALQPLQIEISKSKFDFKSARTQSFRKIPISQLSTQDVTFKTDKRAVELLRKRIIGS